MERWGTMTDEQTGEYLRHLEAIAAERYRPRSIGRAPAPLIRHATLTERVLLRAWLWLIRAR